MKDFFNKFLIADLSPEHTGGAFLSLVDSVSALSGFLARGRALHQVRISIVAQCWLENYAWIHGNTVPPDSSTVGIVPSFTWGRRFRKIWMTRAPWWIVLDGERQTRQLRWAFVPLYFLSLADCKKCIYFCFLIWMVCHFCKIKIQKQSIPHVWWFLLSQ